MSNIATFPLDDGGMIIGPAPAQEPAAPQAHFANLAQTMGEDTLKQIADDLIQKVEEDKKTKAEWEAQVARSISLLGIGPEAEPDTAEDESSDTSNSSLLLKALVKFQSQALSEMLPADRYVSAKPVVTYDLVDPQQREQIRADAEAACRRVERFYQDYFDEQLPAYVDEHDMAIFDVGLTGAAFKKIYQLHDMGWSPVQVEHVPSEKLIVSYDARSLYFGRVTHEIDMPASELIRMMDAGRYRILDVGEATSAPDSNPVTEARDKIAGLTGSAFSEKDTHKLYETCVDMVLEEDIHPRGLMRTYVVTIHVDTAQVLSLRRNWRQNDQHERRIQAFSNYSLHPSKRIIFGLGLGDILSNATESTRKAQRRALEAAYLQNHPFGWKKSNFSIRNENNKILPGELVDVDTPAERIQDAIMMNMFQGPSPGLIQLMEMQKQDGEELGGLTMADLSSMVQGDTPVGTALAALDESSVFKNAIHFRLYRGFKRELALVHENMREVVGNQQLPFGDGDMLMPGDLMKCKINPAMKPGQATRQRRIMEAQAALQAGQQMPQVANQKAALIRFYDAMGIENPQDLVVQEQQAKPADAVTEQNMAVMGSPLKAGVLQDHQSHMTAHIASMQLLANSQVTADRGEQANAMMSAHIAEHWALDLALQVGAAVGIPPQAFEQGIPPEVEQQVAPAIAQALMTLQELRGEMPKEDVQITVEKLRAQSKTEIERIKQETNLTKAGMDTQIAADQNVAKVRMNTDDNVQSEENLRVKGAEDRKTACAKAACEPSGEGDKPKRAKVSPNVDVGVKTEVKGRTNNPEPSRGL